MPGESHRTISDQTFTRLKREAMPIIGVGGPTAGGKTTVCRLFRKWGARVVDADEIGRHVVESDPNLLRELVRAFGEQIIDSSGMLDRRKLGDIVFHDPQARIRLNAIVHPPLLAELRNRVRTQHQQQPDSIIVIDAALIFDWDLGSLLDMSIVVQAGQTRRLDRLLTDKGLTTSQAQDRIRSQSGLELTNASADIVITNDGSLEDLEERTREVWEQIKSKIPNSRLKKTPDEQIHIDNAESHPADRLSLDQKQETNNRKQKTGKEHQP